MVDHTIHLVITVLYQYGRRKFMFDFAYSKRHGQHVLKHSRAIFTFAIRESHAQRALNYRIPSTRTPNQQPVDNAELTPFLNRSLSSGRWPSKEGCLRYDSCLVCVQQ